MASQLAVLPVVWERERPSRYRSCSYHCALLGRDVSYINVSWSHFRIVGVPPPCPPVWLTAATVALIPQVLSSSSLSLRYFPPIFFVPFSWFFHHLGFRTTERSQCQAGWLAGTVLQHLGSVVLRHIGRPFPLWTWVFQSDPTDVSLHCQSIRLFTKLLRELYRLKWPHKPHPSQNKVIITTGLFLGPLCCSSAIRLRYIPGNVWFRFFCSSFCFLTFIELFIPRLRLPDVLEAWMFHLGSLFRLSLDLCRLLPLHQFWHHFCSVLSRRASIMWIVTKYFIFAV